METNVLSGRLAIFRINYKSDFIITLNSDAGWMTPFCIKFWTGAPSQAYFAGWDGTTYTNCAPVQGDPTKLEVQFDDHHLPVGELKFQIGYYFTVADFPTTVEDEVLNQERVVISHDGQDEKVLLDFNGETAPDIQFSLPAYANEAQRIANEEQRIANEQQRIYNEEQRIANEQTRQQNEAHRIAQESARVQEFARLKRESESATSEATAAATLANTKAQLAADKAALAQSAADLANAKAQLASDKAALAQAAATIANDKATLAQQKAEYAQAQGDYAKAQGDYAKEQGEIAEEDHERAEADHTRAESDHVTAGSDHTTAASDHTRAEGDHTTASNDHTRADGDHSTASADHTTATNDHAQAVTDHTTATSDHTQAGNDHTRAESDHTRAESDHAAVEVYVDSLGAFDLSKYNAVGGVLATYADLSEALTALNALPADYKTGGMSFKFIKGSSQSSDNKYVQARCMAQNFTTDVTQWQGVDDEPTAGSKNLVESGGVMDLQLIKAGISDYSYTNGYYEDDGTSHSGSAYRRYEVPLTKDIKTVRAFVNRQLNFNVYGIVFFNENTFISGVYPLQDGSALQWITGIVPDGATTCYVVSRKEVDETFDSVQIKTYTTIKALSEKIDSVSEDLTEMQGAITDELNSLGNEIELISTGIPFAKDTSSLGKTIDYRLERNAIFELEIDTINFVQSTVIDVYLGTDAQPKASRIARVTTPCTIKYKNDAYDRVSVFFSDRDSQCTGYLKPSALLKEEYPEASFICEGASYGSPSFLFDTDDVSVGENIFYNFNVSGQGSAVYIELLDSNSEILGDYGKVSSASQELEFSGNFEIPSNFAKAVLICGNSNIVATFDSLQKSFGNKALDVRVNEIENIVPGKTFGSEILVYHGYYLKNNSDTLVISESFSTSDYINVKGFQRIRMPYAGSTRVGIPLAFYDAYKNRIAIVDNVNNSTELFDVAVPDGAAYIRVCSINTNSTFSVELYGVEQYIRDNYGIAPNSFVSVGGFNAQTVAHYGDIESLPVVRCMGSIAKNGNVIYSIMSCTADGGDSGLRKSLFIAHDVSTNENILSTVVFYDGVGAYFNDEVFYDADGVLGDAGTLYAFACYNNDYRKFYYEVESSDEVDFVYKTSIDGGLTWSNEISLKSLTPEGYIAVGCSPSSPIVLANGTFCMPGFFLKPASPNPNKYMSGLITKKKNHDWVAIPLDLDDSNIGENETAIVEYGNNTVMLNVRPKSGIYARGVYFTSEIKPGETFSFYKHPSWRTMPILNSYSCQASICKYKGLYYLSTVDFTGETARRNILLYVSQDTNKWFPVLYLFVNTQTKGYSHLLSQNDTLSVLYEADNGYNIKYADLTSVVDNIMSGTFEILIKHTPDERLLEVQKFKEQLSS